MLLLINLVEFGIKSDKWWLASGILNASWNRWNIFSITRLLNCAAAENEADTREETRRYFLFAPYLSNPRDLDFFKRNICICCSPPFYFSLFALGATSLPEQVTCRIFHFLLLEQPNLSLMNSMLANNIRIIDHHQHKMLEMKNCRSFEYWQRVWCSKHRICMYSLDPLILWILPKSVML